MSKSVITPNIDEISESTAKMLLLPVFDNSGPPFCNFTSYFNFDLLTVIGMEFCIGVQTVI